MTFWQPYNIPVSLSEQIVSSSSDELSPAAIALNQFLRLTRRASLVGDEVHHVEPDVVVVPHVEVSVLGAVGQHGQHSPRGPQVEGHVDWLPFQQVVSEGDPGVLGVGHVQDAAGDEGVARLAAGVRGVDVGRDGEGLLVQLGHRDALVHAGGEDQPQAVLVGGQFEVGLGVLEEVGQAVVLGVLDGQLVEPLGLEVVPVREERA